MKKKPNSTTTKKQRFTTNGSEQEATKNTSKPHSRAPTAPRTAILLALATLLLVNPSLQLRLQCDPKDMISPINLEMPLPYEKFSPMMHFTKPDEALDIKKISPNVYKLEGDFGMINFLGKTHQIKEVYFKSPSEHTVSGVSFAMEMQIHAPGTPSAPGLVISNLFEKQASKVNSELMMMGFGSGKLRHTKTGKSFKVLNPVSLGDVLGDTDSFINYQGEMSAGDCRMVEWLINVETGEIGGDQLIEFMKDKDPKASKLKARTPGSRTRITQNFNTEVKLKVRKRYKDINKISKVFKKMMEKVKKAKIEAEKKRKKLEAERRKKAKEEAEKRKKLELARKKKAKEEAEKKRKLELARRKKVLEKQRKRMEAKRKKIQKMLKERKRLENIRKKKEAERRKKEAERRKKEELKRLKARFDPKNGILFQEVKITSKKRILEIPKQAVMPFSVTKSKTKKLLKEESVDLFKTPVQLFPPIKKKNLQWRVIFYYIPIGDRKDRFTKTGMARFIPHIVKVPKDYNPSYKTPVTAIPIYNEKTKKIAVKHLRKMKSRDEWEKSLLSKLKKKSRKKKKAEKVCFRWTLKIKIDDKGNAKRLRRCTKWMVVKNEVKSTLMDKKKVDLLNSMGSMKWIVKGLVGNVYH